MRRFQDAQRLRVRLRPSVRPVVDGPQRIRTTTRESHIDGLPPNTGTRERRSSPQLDHGRGETLYQNMLPEEDRGIAQKSPEWVQDCSAGEVAPRVQTVRVRLPPPYRPLLDDHTLVRHARRGAPPRLARDFASRVATPRRLLRPLCHRELFPAYKTDPPMLSYRRSRPEAEVGFRPRPFDP